MKTKQELKQLRDQFLDEYRPAFSAVGNNLSAGIGNDTIEARLVNNKLHNSLPNTYHGVKVNLLITGPIKALGT